MSLCGDILAETTTAIRFRVLTSIGDAPAHGIQGEHEISKADIVEVRRRDKKLRPHDELQLSAMVLDKLARSSFPLES